MKAISLWEPWASLIRCGAKTWETRHWPTRYRGELLICAAKRCVTAEIIHYLSMWAFVGGLAPLIGKPLNLDQINNPEWYSIQISDLNFGKAVAIVNLVDCKKTDDLTLGEIDTIAPFGDFSLGRFAWKLENLKVIDPFPVEGKQGFFNVEMPTQ